ncbi:MAG: Gfo/Idh/MocA family oxidoreductase [Lachnospiraceae bacterium]|nr:Gfo/Idh/MocA family oxidoreductase [Lachnospiraceae bacterium]
MKKIAIIGCGNIGSRHLQAIKKCRYDMTIIACENNLISREISNERFLEIEQNGYVHELNWIDDYRSMKGEVDVVIIATSSNVRYEIATWLLENLQIGMMILEKVVFQKNEDFDNFAKIVSREKTDVYVNCPRRLFSFYSQLKQDLRNSNMINMYVYGNNWGIACNSIHMIDLYEYISDNSIEKYDSNELKEVICKRKGFVEFTGDIRLVSSRGKLILSAYDMEPMNQYITIVTEEKIINIDEMSNEAYIIDNKTKSINRIDVDFKYQSDLTCDVIDDYFREKKCGLTSYNDSANMHKMFISGINRYLSDRDNMEVELCPIT